MRTFRGILAFLFLFLAPGALPAAQEDSGKPQDSGKQEDSLLVSRGHLPEGTLFYLSWNPTRDLSELRQTNPVLRLFETEDMKVNWVLLKDYFSQMAEAIADAESGQSGRKKKKKKEEVADLWPDFPQEEFFQLASRPGLVAVVLPPFSEEAFELEEPVLLMQFDLADDVELMEELIRTQGVHREILREYDLDGIPVEEFGVPEAKPDFFLARVDQWVAVGSDKEIAEAWFLALRDHQDRLGASEAYRRAAERRNEAAQLEFYFSLAQVIDLAESWDRRPPPGAKADTEFEIDLGKAFEALGLKDWESFLLGLALEEERVQFTLSSLYRTGRDQGPAVLAASVKEFSTIEFAPPDTLSYSVTRINLGAIWGYAERAMRNLLPPQQIRWVFGMRGMVEGMMGVKIAELAESWGPEYAQVVYTSGEEKDLRSLYAMRVSDAGPIQTVVRNLLPMFAGKLTVSEQEVETGTLFEVERPGEEEEGFQGFAALLTPEWLVFGANREELESALDRAEAGPSLRSSPAWQEVRARLPAELSSFSFDNVDLWQETGKLEETVNEAGKLIAEGVREQIRKQRDQARRRREEAEPRAEDEPEEPGASEEETDSDAESGEETGPGGDSAPAGDAEELAEEDSESDLARQPEAEAGEDAEGDAELETGEIPLVEEDFLKIDFPLLTIPRGYIKWIFSGTTRDRFGLHHVSVIE